MPAWPLFVRPANPSCWWCLAHKPSHGWWSDTKMMVGVAWAQTPFQRGRLTRLSVWGFVVQWSLCSWSFSCLHCVSDLTQVFVAGPAGYADCISQTYGLFHWLMHGHCLPGFWTRNPKIFEPMMLLLISKAVRLVGPWIPGAWFMLARLTVLPVWCISIHQISFGRCADRLLRSRMLCTCHRLCKQFFWESAQLWPSPYVLGMLRLLFWWPSLHWPAWCVCAHHGQIHFCLPRTDVAFLARTSRGRVNSCALAWFCLGNEHSRLDLRASSLDDTYPWPLHKRVFLCFFASGCYAIKCSGLATGLEQVRHKLPWDVGEHHVRLLARLSFHQWFVDDMEISGDWGPIWLRSWLALASWPGTGVCVCVFSPSSCGAWWGLLPTRGSLSWASLNMVALFFALALPFRSFEHPFSRRWPLDHLRCALWQWLLLCHMPLRLVNGDNSLGAAKRLRCRLVLVPFQPILTLQLSPVQLVKVRSVPWFSGRFR